MMLNGRQLPTVMCTWHSVSSWDGSCNISWWCLMRMCHQQEMGQCRVVVKRRRSGSASSDVLTVFAAPVPIGVYRYGSPVVCCYRTPLLITTTDTIGILVSVPLMNDLFTWPSISRALFFGALTAVITAVERRALAVVFSTREGPRALTRVITVAFTFAALVIFCAAWISTRTFSLGGPSPNGQDQGNDC